MSSKEEKILSVSEMFEAEQAYIRERRNFAGRAPGDPARDSVGLGLSGGGVRSATFNLGLLQALHKTGILTQVDYLSTVSGGGYIGSCLTWLKSRCPATFPFGTERKDYDGSGGSVLAWLRAHGSYLMPGDGINIWAMIAAVLTGILVNLVVLVPVFLTLIYLLSREFARAIEYTRFISWLPGMGSVSPWGNDGFSLLLYFSWGLFSCFLISIAVFAVSTRFMSLRNYPLQRSMREISGMILMTCALLFVIGTLPYVDHLVAGAGRWLTGLKIGAIPLTGVASAFFGARGRKRGNETRGVRAVLLSLGLALMAYGVFLLFYHLAGGPEPIFSMGILAPMLAVSLFFAFMADINQVSMHRFYRNRLMEAYMPFSIQGAGPEENGRFYPYATEKDMDLCRLCDIRPTDAPYHIINTNLQTVGSSDVKLQKRGGENFIFSPKFVGSFSTTFVETRAYMGGTTTLATAMAVSGAAVDPNSYATRSRPLSFLMSLLNVRLGAWVRNPGHKDAARTLRNPLWYYYMFREMLGRGLDEHCVHLHLSDGGHFENLGIYELVRRRCRILVISDAAADPDYTFGDLGKAIELIRVDFGAEVEIDVTPLMPAEGTRVSPSAVVRGKIRYIDGRVADLFYVKTTLIKGVSEDINAYSRSNGRFPDQTTADQFFNEKQFEAYRELGYSIGKRLEPLWTFGA